ncbi:MAG: hypothetical protein N2422_07265 [Rhodobacteraceae bacterium]|nr:hypothetical protein [Paracoccaceae bacterium]
MKLALNILGRRQKAGQKQPDRFESRLKAMTSPAVTGPRLRRVSPPGIFSFRSRGAA